MYIQLTLFLFSSFHSHISELVSHCSRQKEVCIKSDETYSCLLYTSAIKVYLQIKELCIIILYYKTEP